jgi:hypothetical protein
MKFIYLLLSSLALASCSNGSEFDDSKSESKLSSEDPMTISRNSIFNGIPPDMIKHITGFMEPKDMANWRDVNSLTRFSLSLKETVASIFNIAGLENVADNEPELAGIKSLAWTTHDPLLLFTALMEEVAFGKKPYKVLSRPLIIHLFHTFRAFSIQDKKKYLDYLRDRKSRDLITGSVEEHLAAICGKHGHFDLLFDLFKEEKEEIARVFLRTENRKKFFEFIRNNDHYLRQFLDALISRAKYEYMHEYSFKHRFGTWIAQCIINDMPEEYYIPLFAVDPYIPLFALDLAAAFKFMIKYMIKYLILSINVPETEYPRIHDQVGRIVRIYSAELTKSRMLEFLEIINDIRFGNFDWNNLQGNGLSSIETSTRTEHLQIAIAALLANKQGLFRSICSRFNLSLLGEDVYDFTCLEFDDDFSLENYQVKNYKIFFEMIQENPENINELNERLLSFIMKFYAVKFLKLNVPGVVTFEFEVSEKLLDFGFPPVLHISQNCHKVEGFIISIFSRSKVVNESTLTTFIPDLVEYSRIISIPTMFGASDEFVEYISKLPNILELLIDNKIKLSLLSSVANMDNYFNLPNFELTRQIIAADTYFNLYHCNLYQLSILNNKDHLEKFEIIQGVKVSSCFLDWERTQGWGKFHYFEWRPVFAYWIKGSDRNELKQIQTREIIEMLKLDFPDEAKKLFK